MFNLCVIWTTRTKSLTPNEIWRILVTFLICQQASENARIFFVVREIFSERFISLRFYKAFLFRQKFLNVRIISREDRFLQFRHFTGRLLLGHTLNWQLCNLTEKIFDNFFAFLENSNSKIYMITYWEHMLCHAVKRYFVCYKNPKVRLTVAYYLGDFLRPISR